VLARIPRRALWLGIGPLLGLACAAHAVDQKPASPDSEFLEYLGSSDDVDSELQQYLAKPDSSAAQDEKPAPKRGSGRT
jgi:hypothetical protein